MSDLILLSVFVALLSCDTLVFGQFMISRPVITGPIIGWWLGHPYIGFIIGICLELMWIRVIPVGVTIPPDTTIATALATAGAINAVLKYGIDDASAIIMALAISIPCGIIYKVIDLRIRMANSLVADKVKSKIIQGKTSSVNVATLFGIFSVFALSFLFFLVFISLINRLPEGYWSFIVRHNFNPRVILRFVYIVCFAQLFEAFIKWK